jgi:signal transduction histidine kinase
VPSARGVSPAVLAAGFTVAVGAFPTLMGFNESSVPTGALYGAGWPAFGVAAALLLDRGRETRLGVVLAVLALAPAVVVAVALPAGDLPVWGRVERVWQSQGLVLVLAASVAIVSAAGFTPGRLSRRRLSWLLAWSALLLAAVSVVRVDLDPRSVAVVMTLGLWGLAGLVVRLATATDLRPLDEPLVDVAAAVLTLVIGAGVGVLVGVAATRAGIPAPGLSAAFAAVISAALAWPAARLVRRSWLERRYGAGALTPADVEAITADLHHLSDPRELLRKAADMVAACSGHREVTLVLGEDGPDVPPGWVEHPLLVGGDRVGTLLLDPADAEGPEPRQARIVEQLVPTVALVSRAVGLAVEAEHARQDVARERDAERARILGDLHDGLGPVLAGMSMRVQAELRTRPTPLLQSLATELAESRGDLRRIVAGLTPSALDDTDLAGALARLVDTFNGDGRQVAVEVIGDLKLSTAVAVAVYRSVAEGITNAFRHGRASHVTVRVSTAEAGQVWVDVRDDGRGGPIAPGVGLTSLRRRAEQLGGSLLVEPCPAAGVLLHVELPAQGAA